MLPAKNSDRILISRDNPHSHLGLANPRTRAQHTADSHIHLYIAHIYAHFENGEKDQEKEKARYNLI